MVSDENLPDKTAGDQDTLVPDGAAKKTAPQGNDQTISHLDAADGLSTLSPQGPNDRGQTPLQQIGDYDLLEEIARGGMGVVYRARQRDLNRVVALKMILSGEFAKEEEVQRFKAEAAAAAGLDHPGIVPIYEVGQHQGQHFFSMGFVEGKSLAERIAESPLDAKEAARMLAKIAEAVHYAHQHGVIHRDLKPSNVLLPHQENLADPPAQSTVANRGATSTGSTRGSRGSSSTASTPDSRSAETHPKITDFGLAKRLQSQSELTASGQVLGTPSYMPPEQASGRVDQIDERSDVYSLGAILYCMVTGRPPFASSSPVETLRQVLDREPVPPRQFNPSIDLDLETICLKCLEKAPGKRYASASDAQHDLQRYLDGQPIEARPVSRAERVTKWARRQPALASLILIALAASVAFVASILVYNSRLQTNNKQLAEAVENEQIQTGIAQREAEQAARQTQIAYDTLHSVLNEIQNGLEYVPGAQHSREEMLKKTVGGLEKIAASLELAPVANASLAVAHYELGTLLLETGGDSLSRGEFRHNPRGGRRDYTVIQSRRATTDPRRISATRMALGQFQKSAELSRQLGKDEPDNAEHFLQLMMSLHRMGVASLRLGEFTEAQQHMEESLRIAKHFSNQDDPAVMQASAAIYNHLGETKERMADTPGALKDYQQVLKLTKRVHEIRPDGLDTIQNLAVAHERLASISLTLGDPAACAKEVAEAMRLTRILLDNNPDNYDTLKNMIVMHNLAAEAQVLMNDAVGAIKTYRKGLAMGQGVLAVDPANRGMQRVVADIESALGSVSLQLGDVATAEQAHRDSLATYEILAAADPQRVDYQFDISAAHSNLASVLETRGDLAGARAAFETSLQQLERALAKHAGEVTMRLRLGSLYERLGDLALRQQDIAAARDAHQKSLDIRHELVRQDPAVACNNRNLSVSYNKFVFLNVQLGDMKAAQDAVKKGLEIAQGLVDANPEHVEAHRDLSVSYEYQGNVEMTLGNLKAARDAYKKSAEIRDRIAREAPEDARAQTDLATIVVNLGVLHMELGELDEAKNAFTRNLEIKQSAAEQDTENADIQRTLGLAYERLGEVIGTQGDPAGAIKQFQKRLEIARRLVEISPTDHRAKVDVASALWKLGLGHLQNDDVDAALTTLKESLDLMAPEAAADPANINHQLVLADIHEATGDAHQKNDAVDKAIESTTRSYEIHKRLAEAIPNPRLRDQLKKISAKLAKLKEPAPDSDAAP